MSSSPFIKDPVGFQFSFGDNTYNIGAFNGLELSNTATSSTTYINSTGFTTGSQSFSFNALYLLKTNLSAVAPNFLVQTNLAVNNSLLLENNDTAPTRTAHISCGDPTITGQHFGIQYVGNSQPFTIQSLDATDFKLQDTCLSLDDDGTGYNITPNLKINNDNATAGTTMGVPSFETYKSGRNAVAGDIIHSQHHYAKDSIGTKTEFGRIRTTAVSSSNGAEHGSVGI